MAATHESANETANVGKRLRLATPTARLSVVTARHGELPHYADLCSGILQEARSLASAGRYGPALVALLARASDLLDDIDDFLVELNPLRDGDAYLRAADLHRVLEEIQARLPRRLRGRVSSTPR